VVSGGTIDAGDATAAQAQSDLTTAYNTAAGTPCNVDLTGQNLGGLTLMPGVYCFATTAALTGTLTLDLQGNSNAFFLFKIGSTLTTAANSSMILINTGGASCAQNIFWQVGSSATFGSGSSSTGSLLVLTSITLTTNAALSGSALARNGAVTMDTNSVVACAAATPVRLQSFGVD
jgi:type VI secretion system secreted protein VgrG